MYGFPRRPFAYDPTVGRYQRYGLPSRGLVAFHRASTLLRSMRDGDAVDRWPGLLVDNELTTITAAKPVLRAGNGRPYVESTGSEQLVSAANLGITGSGARTLALYASFQGTGITVALGGYGGNRTAFAVAQSTLFTWGYDLGIALPSALAVVTLTYDGATIRVRASGVVVQQLNAGALATSNGPLRLFNWGYGDRPASARVAAVAVWDRVLSADEIGAVETLLAHAT